MNLDKNLPLHLFLLVVAGMITLVVISFRMASCQETVVSYHTRIATCECLEPDRVSVSVEAAKPAPTP